MGLVSPLETEYRFFRWRLVRFRNRSVLLSTTPGAGADTDMGSPFEGARLLLLSFLSDPPVSDSLSDSSPSTQGSLSSPLGCRSGSPEGGVIVIKLLTPSPSVCGASTSSIAS